MDKGQTTPAGRPQTFKGFSAKVENANESERTIVARISTIDVDAEGDVMLPRGIDLSRWEKNRLVLWQHDWMGSILPIGKGLWIKATEREVLAKTEFNETPFAMDIFRLYAEGYLSAWSVGFDILAARDVEAEDVRANPEMAEARRIIEKWLLYEYSAVKLPCNPNALVLAREKGLTLSTPTATLLGIEKPSAKIEPEEAVVEPEEAVIAPPRIETAAPKIRPAVRLTRRRSDRELIRDVLALERGLV